MNQTASSADEKQPDAEPTVQTKFAKWKTAWMPFLPLLTSIITGAGTWYLMYVWHTPDVRYEVGPYYRSGGVAVASLKLTNYGGLDAEDVSLVTKAFPEILVQDVGTSEEVVPFTVKSGGKGSKAVAGTIPRLVPGQKVYLYFAIKNPDGPVPATDIVDKVIYKGGMGQTGQPISLLVIILGLIALLIWASLFWSFYKTTREWKEDSKKSAARLQEARAALERQEAEAERQEAFVKQAKAIVEQIRAESAARKASNLARPTE